MNSSSSDPISKKWLMPGKTLWLKSSDPKNCCPSGVILSNSSLGLIALKVKSGLARGQGASQQTGDDDKIRSEIGPSTSLKMLKSSSSQSIIKELSPLLPISRIQALPAYMIIHPSMNSKSTGLAPKQNELLPLPDQVNEFFAARIQVEEEYARALQRLNNRLDNIESNQTQCGNMLMCLKSIHSERAHQVGEFVEQLKRQKGSFMEAVDKAHKEVQKSNNQLKTVEKALKNTLDKISKLQAKGELEIKEIDQKFILREIGHLASGFKKKQVAETLKILAEQSKVEQKSRQQYESLKVEGEKMLKKIKKHEKIIREQSPQIQAEITELVKKYLVLEISLIRNIQYDVDNMIKRTQIFDEKPPAEAAKPPINPVAKAAKDIFKKQFSLPDPYANVKKQMADKTTIQKRKPGKLEASTEIGEAWKDPQAYSHLLQRINQPANRELRLQALEFVGSFRHKGNSRMGEKQFEALGKLFHALMKQLFEEKDLVSIQQLIIYGSVYACEGTKECMMDRIKKEQYLSDVYFWKFLLYFAILESVSECADVEQEPEMHARNNVFSALVSNSLNMMAAGIDKYQVRNTVAKMSKSFGLGEAQLADLLKFIDQGSEKYEKFKK